MNSYIIRSGWIAAMLVAGVMIALPAQAASFDCAKAGTKVEHMVCDNPEISKLDEELSRSYKAALQDQSKADQIKQAQKQWLNDRNACQYLACLRSAYQGRITQLTVKPNMMGERSPAQADYTQRVSSQKNSNTDYSRQGHYSLAMSKNDEMCNHMLLLTNDDLKLNGRTFDRHDGFVSSHKEFNIIPWSTEKVMREGKLDESWEVETALFDLNNDGTKDFVVLEKSMLSGMRADSLYMLDAAVAKRENGLTSDDLREAKNYIHIAGWFYELSIPTNSRKTEPLWLLSPFIYNGVSYIYMQSLYKSSEAIGRDFVVIAKYGEGKFENRQMTGKMEDICYIERIDEKNNRGQRIIGNRPRMCCDHTNHEFKPD